MLQQVELASTFFNKFFICCSYYHPRNKFLRNNIWETSSDWTKFALQHRANFITSTKMAAGENELILLDQKLSEAHKFELFRELKNYLWESSKSDYKNRHMKTVKLWRWKLCVVNSSNSLKIILHSVRTAFVREVKREGNGQKSAWKFFEVLQYIRKKTCFGQWS